MKPTLASQRMVGITPSILPREGKTNEYRSGTSKSKYGHQYIIQIHPSPYIYDHQIMTLIYVTKMSIRAMITITQ